MRQSSPTSRLTDEEMIQQVFPHQPSQCFSLLYQRYVNKVYQRCLSMTKDAESAKDFTQDIFLKVFTKLDAFRERAQFSTWLYSISYNYCADQLRLRKRLTTTSLDEMLDVEPADTQVDCWHEETLRAVKNAMQTLSVQDQLLLQSKYENGLSVTEMAQLHGLTESTVKIRLKRSRDKIQRLSSQHLND